MCVASAARPTRSALGDFGGRLDDPGLTIGAISLCYRGCALRDWLVATGSARGTMWSDTRSDDVDLAPILRYLAWLADAASEHDCSRSPGRRDTTGEEYGPTEYTYCPSKMRWLSSGCMNMDNTVHFFGTTDR